jgi:hypothetical protein
MPYDNVTDGIYFWAPFLVQGFASPTSSTLTTTMSTDTFQGVECAVALISKKRIVRHLGDPSLTYTYPANTDTYDDLDAGGIIYHTSVR